MGGNCWTCYCTVLADVEASPVVMLVFWCFCHLLCRSASSMRAPIHTVGGGSDHSGGGGGSSISARDSGGGARRTAQAAFQQEQQQHLQRDRIRRQSLDQRTPGDDGKLGYVNQPFAAVQHQKQQQHYHPLVRFAQLTERRYAYGHVVLSKSMHCHDRLPPSALVFLVNRLSCPLSNLCVFRT